MNELEIIPQCLKTHPWVGQNLKLSVQNLELQSQKAWLYSKISFCAVAALSLTTIALSFFIGSTSKRLPLLAVSSLIATPYLAMNASKYQSKARFLEQFLSVEKVILIQLEKIHNWPEKGIKEFLVRHNLHPHPGIPLVSLLPVIARYMAKAEEAIRAIEFSDYHLKAEGIQDRDLRFAMRCIGWNALENKAVPAAIEAAFALHVLNHPFISYFFSDKYEMIRKSFAERQFDRLYGPDDKYLVLRSDENSSFSLQELLEDLNPDSLHKKIPF